MTEETSSHLTITVPRFDGPFDLLISLILRNEWSIDDLPVLEITRQFLEYIRSAKDMDTELGGQFIETASWLVLLKSRSLLPSDVVESPAPKEELRRALLDKEALASAAGFLRDRSDGQPRPTSAGAPAGRRDPIVPEVDEGLSLKALLDEALEAVASARAAASFRSTDGYNITVEDQLHWIAAKTKTLPKFTAVSTVPWFAMQPTPVARIALLLAILELARQGFILIYQVGEFAAILIKSIREIPLDLQSLDDQEVEGLPLILT